MADKIARYEFRVVVDLPIDAEDDPQTYLHPLTKRNLEKSMISCLKRLSDGDVSDLECMTAGIVDE